MPKAASGSLMRIFYKGLSREVSSAFLVSYCAIWILRIIFRATDLVKTRSYRLKGRRQARGLATGVSRVHNRG